MRILFAGGNSWLPEASGGTQYSTDHLIRRSLAEGHDCAVYCGTMGRGLFGFSLRVQRKLMGRLFSIDRRMGYDVMRCWEPMDPKRVRAVIARFRPDVVVVQTKHSATLAQRFAEEGVPVVLYLRNVEFAENGGDVSAIPGARFIANSPFTAAKYKEEYGIDCAVIPPTIDVEKYRTETTRRMATLINIHPKKGLEVALGMAAACPDIPFLFVEAWILLPEDLEPIKAKMDALPNVTFMPRTDDMSRVYGQTKIVLAPSQWEEAWGRVASEAHCSGIPVIGSDRGGLPQAIGPGGIVVPHDAPIADWAAALRRLWDDPAAYAAASASAEEYARRPELDFEQQYRTFISVLEAAAQSAEPAKVPA